MNNVVNAYPSWALGQDATPPDFNDPNIIYGSTAPSDGGGQILSPYQTWGSPDMAPTPQRAPGPTATVPQPTPSGLPGFTFPSTTVRDLYPQGLPPGPSPRVNVPISAPGGVQMWLQNNWVTVAALGVGIVLLSNLGGGGRRRR